MSDPTIVQVTDADVDPVLREEILREGRTKLKDVPDRWRDATVTEPAVADWVSELVALAVKHRGVGDPIVRRGPSLLLTGPTGTGKTHQAWGVVRALSVSGVWCRWRFVRAGAWFRSLEPSSGLDTAAEFAAAACAGLLVFDDLGATKNSPAREEALTELISERDDHLRPTLVTTNKDELGGVVGERVASRLAQMCRGVALTGSDRRRGGAA